MRKTFTLFAFACLGLGLNAQFVRTDMGDLGDSQIYRRADTTGVQDGASGTGQNWDYSTLVATSTISTNAYILPSAHPQGSNYPTANLCLNPGNGAFEFYKSNADSLYVIGEKSPANTRVTYTDGAAWFRYPQAFGVPNEDSVYGAYPDGFISTVTRAGWIRTTFEASGSLTTPFATYPAVKRIEYLAAHRDSSLTGAANVDLYVKRYEWYATGVALPVLIIHHQQVILNNGNPTNSKEVLWADDNAVAVAPATTSQFEIYPNPSQGETTLRYRLDASDDVRIEVLSIVGGRVRLVADASQAAGSYSYDLAQGLAKGVYMVRMVSSKGATTQKMILN